MASGITRIGIVGCGKISRVYTENIRKFNGLEVAACADLIDEVARQHCSTHGVPRALGVKELIADSDIDVILNLTIPAAHAEISIAALRAGKHVYSEKPLATVRDDGRAILDTAAKAGLRVGCAPDTVLGAGIQTCRKLIDDGWIGRPTGAAGFMLGGGPESWHPSPFFFYQPGGGPLFDMGPYYLTAMVVLLGPVANVTAMAGKGVEQRMVGSGPHAGSPIKVEIPTHVAGLLEFSSGAIGTLITSFDAPGRSTTPRIEIYGTEGTLIVPDPNGFGGPVRVRREGYTDNAEVPLAFRYSENTRGLGLADMVAGVRFGRPHRARGDIALHVLDIMQSLIESAEARAWRKLETACERPDPFPTDQKPFIFDR